MGAPYSPDLRKRVIAAVDEGLEAYSAATHFRVSVSYIYKALARRRATGEETARAAGRGPSPKLVAYDSALRARVTEQPDITLATRRTASLVPGRTCNQGQRRLPMEAVASTRAHAQKKSQHAAEQQRANVALARADGHALQAEMNPEKLA